MKVTIIIFLLIISPLTIAQIVSGIDYINLRQEVTATTTKFDANVNGLVLVAGYSFAYSDIFH